MHLLSSALPIQLTLEINREGIESCSPSIYPESWNGQGTCFWAGIRNQHSRLGSRKLGRKLGSKKLGRKYYADNKCCFSRTLFELYTLRKIAQKINYEYWILKAERCSVTFRNISGWTMENHIYSQDSRPVCSEPDQESFRMYHGDETMRFPVWAPHNLTIDSLSMCVTIQPISVIVLLWIVQFISRSTRKQWTARFILRINVNPTFVIIQHCSLHWTHANYEW